MDDVFGFGLVVFVFAISSADEGLVGSVSEAQLTMNMDRANIPRGLIFKLKEFMVFLYLI